jgi:hypothetical protein
VDPHPPTTPVVQPRRFPSRATRILFICIWTVVSYFASGAIIGFASGLYFFGRQPNQQTMWWIGLSWSLAPWIGAFIGLVLGLKGWLPGTRPSVLPRDIDSSGA